MIRQIKSTAHTEHAAFLTESSCVLDIETDSRYWRTSHFKNVRLADTEKEIIWIPEKESDEYDLLIALRESLSRYSHVLTFNGTGFDIPHLKKKYSAYRLSDPFQNILHDDLLLMLRKYNALLPLARHRLNDYVSLFKESDLQDDDAQKELFISQIMNLSCLRDGKFSAQILNLSCLRDGKSSKQTLNLSCLREEKFSKQIPDSCSPETDIEKGILNLLLVPDLPVCFCVRCSDGPFELDSDPDSGTLRLRIRYDKGSFKMYHTDFENYDYLPAEGCAVHKSLTAFVASDRKMKASRDTCYTLIPCGTILQGNERTLIRYIQKAVEYLMTGPSSQG